MSLASCGVRLSVWLPAQIGADLREKGHIPAKVRCISLATTRLCVLDLLLVAFFVLVVPSRPLRPVASRRAGSLWSREPESGVYTKC